MGFFLRTGRRWPSVLANSFCALLVDTLRTRVLSGTGPHLRQGEMVSEEHSFVSAEFQKPRLP